MKTDQEKDVLLIQTNRFIKEWDDNLALERETRNELGRKHRYEHQCLPSGEVDSGERLLLIATHLQEIEDLKKQHAKMRKAIEKRQTKETAMLTDRFNRIIQYRVIQVNRLSSVNRSVYSVVVHA
ncbi:hypothetical protein [Spirosoma spitsbergense]|jgi:predicted GNAT superfamily acetyltransferase|uniref:hypothetical protein n=1 Tax=Spirosoma spitsbergense TaxID=431554 RepID=UPI00037BF785|nr:hypothetical protein [Spirosoma spitsbergense]